MSLNNIMSRIAEAIRTDYIGANASEHEGDSEHYIEGYLDAHEELHVQIAQAIYLEPRRQSAFIASCRGTKDDFDTDERIWP